MDTTQQRPTPTATAAAVAALVPRAPAPASLWKRSWLRAALGLGLACVALPLIGEAYERVEYNGKLYACEHRCSITTFQDGSAHIRDAYGGWACLIETNGGVIVDEAGKE